MAAVAVISFLTVATLGLSTDVSVTSSLRFDAEEAKNRPVSKVITLLKDMLKQLEKEVDGDEEVYDKIVCWCETNEKIKTKEIADGAAKIEQLGAKIEELTASLVRLEKEIKALEGEIFEQQGAMDKANALRMKKQAEFNAEEKDLLDAIKALKDAIVVLSKHHPSSFMQVPADTHSAALMQVAATLQHEMQKHDDLLKGVLTHSQRRAAASFLQAPADYFDASPTFKQAYAPQSGQILGILKQMLETFEQNLAAAQGEEGASQKDYGNVKGAVFDQLAAADASRDKKVQDRADQTQAKADAEQDLKDTEALKAANEKYLAMLKEKCAQTDAEWEERQKTRHLEIEAVSKALAILSSDDAHDLFTKTFNAALLQKEETRSESLRSKASELIRAVAEQNNSPRLAALAYQIRLDAFTKVKEAIDNMIAQLLQEKADEIKHKDFCIAELNTNTAAIEKNERAKAELETKIDNLATLIDTRAKELEELKAQIAEMQVQMKRAGEDREIENKEFQLTVADQRATQKLLVAALEVLKGFYAKKAALLQHGQEPVGPPPPPGFEAYKKNENAPGVMGLIEEIINDAKVMEAEAIKAEEDAQTAYEDFVKETNTAIVYAHKAIDDKTKEKAQAETEKAEAEATLEETEAELENLAASKAELHAACDFVLKNFDYRQTARDQEIEALKQAKAILSGAKFNALLQSYGA